MRLLVVTWSAPSHLYPMVPLAWAAVAAGHQVRVAVPPSGAQAVTAAGLLPVVVGADPVMTPDLLWALEPWRRPGRWPPGWASRPELLPPEAVRVLDALAAKQVAVAEAMLDDLVEFARWWRPDLVVYDAISLAGPVVAAVLDVPAYGHTWGTATVMQVEMERLGDQLRPEFRRLFARYCVAPRSAPEGWLDPCPPPMRLPDPRPTWRIPVRPVPFNGATVPPDWLARPADRVRICLTGGVSGAKASPTGGHPLFLTVAEAAADLDVEVVLAVSPMVRPHLPELPSVVRVVESVPITLLLDTCDVVVHHGGSGTGLTAAAAGVPQLVLPQAPVLAEFGERLSACGAGILLDPAEQTRSAVRTALDDLLGRAAYRESARRLASAIAAMPTPAQRVVELLGPAAWSPRYSSEVRDGREAREVV